MELVAAFPTGGVPRTAPTSCCGDMPLPPLRCIALGREPEPDPFAAGSQAFAAGSQAFAADSLAVEASRTKVDEAQRQTKGSTVAH